MEWLQFLILIVTLGALFLWNRSEANSDRRDMMALIKSMENETKSFNEVIRQDIKDFHGRLCSLEERRK